MKLVSRFLREMAKVCLAPGFLNDNRESLQKFINTLKGLYHEAVAFPL